MWQLGLVLFIVASCLAQSEKPPTGDKPKGPATNDLPGHAYPGQTHPYTGPHHPEAGNGSMEAQVKALAQALLALQGVGCNLFKECHCKEPKKPKSDEKKTRQRRAVDPYGNYIPDYAPPSYQPGYPQYSAPSQYSVPSQYSPNQNQYFPVPVQNSASQYFPNRYQGPVQDYAPNRYQGPVQDYAPSSTFGYTDFLPTVPSGLQVSPYFAYSVLANQDDRRKQNRNKYHENDHYNNNYNDNKNNYNDNNNNFNYKPATMTNPSLVPITGSDENVQDTLVVLE